MILATDNGDFDSIDVYSNLDNQLVLNLINEEQEYNLILDKKSAQELINQIKLEIQNLK